jgi:predicted RNase H-like nuclease (RuvC/YqgF family)
MSYASYLEDINEANDDANTSEPHLQRQTEPARQTTRSGFKRKRHQDLLSGYNQMVAATSELQREKAALLSRVRQLEQKLSDRERLRQNNVELRHSTRKLEEDLRSERRRRRAAEYDLKELERRLTSSAGGMERMIDAYSKDADIDFHKPGERKR